MHADDLTALTERATTLAARWEELDTELVGKLREFAVWMREKFPITTTPSPFKYNPPIQHVPVAHELFPTPSARDYWIELSISEPVDKDGFFFTNDDGDGWHLPLGWLKDPEEFFQAVLTDSHARQREAEAQAARNRAKAADRLRAQLAQLEAQ